jgi:asparagine synthase (glutamine-hydrolysing)
MGAEVAPFHLHAMPQVRSIAGIDAVLAGTYGDMVGRAEFSGRHVLRLKPAVPRSWNRFGLVRDALVRDCRVHAEEDAYRYRRRVSRDATYQYRELEQHIHYTRRKLSAAMDCIAQRVPLFQLFTARECFSLMWSLDVRTRDDRYYMALLPTLPGHLAELPWARTGAPLSANGSATARDDLAKEHHRYGLWLRRDLRDTIVDLVHSDAIRGLGVFNDRALDLLLSLWPRATTTTTNALDEIISWLASLAIFVRTYDIQPIDPVQRTRHDDANAWRGLCDAWLYQTAREYVRR